MWLLLHKLLAMFLVQRFYLNLTRRLQKRTDTVRTDVRLRRLRARKPQKVHKRGEPNFPVVTGCRSVRTTTRGSFHRKCSRGLTGAIVKNVNWTVFEASRFKGIQCLSIRCQSVPLHWFWRESENHPEHLSPLKDVQKKIRNLQNSCHSFFCYRVNYWNSCQLLPVVMWDGDILVCHIAGQYLRGKGINCVHIWKKVVKLPLQSGLYSVIFYTFRNKCGYICLPYSVCPCVFTYTNSGRLVFSTINVDNEWTRCVKYITAHIGKLNNRNGFVKQ